MTATVFGYLFLVSTDLTITVFGNVVKHGLSCLIYYITPRESLSDESDNCGPMYVTQAVNKVMENSQVIAIN